MRTITTMNNGNIYQMDIQEAIEIVQAYAEKNTGGDLLQAATEMRGLALLDELPTVQKVAIRRFLKDMAQLLGQVDVETV